MNFPEDNTYPSQLQEVWKPIVGFEGLYEVSNIGRFRRQGSQRILPLGVSERGYLSVHLRTEQGKKVTKKAHPLVAITFLGKRPSGFEVDHVNGVKSDNRVSNLEYVSPGENRHRALLSGRFQKKHITVIEVLKMKALFKDKCFTDSTIARQFGISRTMVGYIRKGKFWKHVALD